MAKCQDCHQEMKTAETCRWTRIVIDGKEYMRDNKYYDYGERCHDCGIVNNDGAIHHFGCDIERCPKCKDQIISCDCNKERLVASKKI
jgi:hypothetical protein